MRKTTDRIYINNLKFHVLMVLSWALNKKSTLPGLRIAQLDPSLVTEAMLTNVATWVFEEFEKAGKSDQVARDSKFTAMLKADWTAAATAQRVGVEH